MTQLPPPKRRLPTPCHVRRRPAPGPESPPRGDSYVDGNLSSSCWRPWVEASAPLPALGVGAFSVEVGTPPRSGRTGETLPPSSRPDAAPPAPALRAVLGGYHHARSDRSSLGSGAYSRGSRTVLPHDSGSPAAHARRAAVCPAGTTVKPWFHCGRYSCSRSVCAASRLQAWVKRSPFTNRSWAVPKKRSR
jgi:hypothetical protein